MTEPPFGNLTLNETARQAVRGLLERSAAYAALTDSKRRRLADDMLSIAAKLAATRREDTPGCDLRRDRLVDFRADHLVLTDSLEFSDFVTRLINRVFEAVVDSSIEQMEAYAKLVAEVSANLNGVGQDTASPQQGREYLLEEFPDLFEMTEEPLVRLSVRPGVDEPTALRRINQSMQIHPPIAKLDDSVAEGVLVSTAQALCDRRRRSAVAELVLMGINRIVVTNGSIEAKLLFDVHGG